MKKILLLIILSVICFAPFSVLGAGNDMTPADVKNTIKNSVQNIPNPADRGFIGDIIANIFNNLGMIKNDFIFALQVIRTASVNTVPRWDGLRFVEGTITDNGTNIAVGGNLSMNNNRIQNLGAPTGPNDAATRDYVDNNSPTYSGGAGIDISVSDTISVDNTVLRTTGSQTKSGNLGFKGAARYIGTIDNNHFLLRTNNLNRIVIRDTGNVGIGITNPSEKLDVLGNIRVTGKIFTQTPGATDPANTVATKGYVDSKTEGNNSCPAQTIKCATRDLSIPAFGHAQAQTYKVPHTSNNYCFVQCYNGVVTTTVSGN